MAIDTAERRKAAGAMSGFVYGLAPGVTPNAFTDQEWIQEAGWGYPGILVTSVTAQAGELNTTLRDYLNDIYNIANPDLVPLFDRYVDEDTITDKTISVRELKVLTDVENR